MPFAPRQHPSIGLSLLKAALSRARDSEIRYFTLDFAAVIGGPAYDRIANSATRTLAGEWVFSERARTCAELCADGALARCAVAARREAGRFLDRAATELLALRPRIVGFSSTFAQHAACLSLARRLKERDPQLCVIFGGANCEGIMGAETLRQFSFVDAVVSGEADAIIVELIERLLHGKPVDHFQGVYTHANLAATANDGYSTVQAMSDLDALPYPDYTDYFRQSARFPELHETRTPRLLFELSRGCWWGEKHHCTFCGLNGSTIRFRRKSARRGIAELRHLVSAYGVRAVELVDNILDMRYFHDFIPAVIDADLGLELFLEVKANLGKEQLRMLRDAGTCVFQPGIEHLDTGVLNLMDKGVTGLRNIQLLKWCKELGMLPQWNLIWGFPGEDEAAYTRIARQIPSISHLPPPNYAGTMRLDRFSPSFDEAEHRGLINVRPCPAYAHVYDLPEASLRNLAYYFVFDYADGRDPGAYTAPLAEAIDRWRRDHEHSELISFDFGDSLLLIDCRPAIGPGVRTLTGLDRVLYLRCDAIAGLTQLSEIARRQGERLGTEEPEARLQPLVDAGLMLREGNAYLSLAIPLGDYAPRGEVGARLAALGSLPHVETLATSRA
jgi:ribosomal peptide maturation radical SAM protein 1